MFEQNGTHLTEGVTLVESLNATLASCGCACTCLCAPGDASNVGAGAPVADNGMGVKAIYQ